MVDTLHHNYVAHCPSFKVCLLYKISQELVLIPSSGDGYHYNDRYCYILFLILETVGRV